MNLLFALAIAIFLTSTPVFCLDSEESSKVDILKWPRMKADELGCLFERELGSSDERFNCALKGYVIKRDPCSADGSYNEGPKLKETANTRIHPLVSDIDLNWEGGKLQALSITMKGSLTLDELKDALRLPEQLSYPKSHPNITDISIQKCGEAKMCVVIQGFEHIGAADIECQKH